MASKNRPEIPEPVKREVRKRCGFGCVLCGLPLYHYDHIEEFSTVGVHDASNLTLLCANHHDQKTRKQLPFSVVREADSNPRNRKYGETSPHRLFYYRDSAEIVIGGNSMLTRGHAMSAISIAGHSLIDFELVEGQLMLNMDFRDREGGRIIEVRRNELVHAVGHWDYKFVGRRLSVRNAPRDIALDVSFDPSAGQVIIERADVQHDGVEVWVHPEALCILNNRLFISGSTFAGVRSVISIGEDDDGAGGVGVKMGEIDHAFDREGAKKWALEQLEDVRKRKKMEREQSSPKRSIAWRACMGFSPLTRRPLNRW